MAHTIHLSGPSGLHVDVARDLANLDWLEVRQPARTSHLELDQGTVSLVVAGMGTVNALIAALATLWSAKMAAARKQTHCSFVVQTDLEEITVDVDGASIAASRPLPQHLADITDIHLLENGRQ